MAHKGKQPEFIRGFQGGRRVCGYWGQASWWKYYKRIVLGLYVVNCYDRYRGGLQFVQRSIVEFIFPHLIWEVLNGEERRGMRRNDKPSQIFVHWDNSGISCSCCPTLLHTHTHTHTNTHRNRISYYETIRNVMSPYLQPFPSVKQSKLSQVSHPFRPQLAHLL